MNTTLSTSISTSRTASRSASTGAKLWPIAGIVVAVVNSVVGASIGSVPRPDAPVDDLRVFLADHRSALLAFGWVTVLSTPLFVCFIAGVVHRARSSTPVARAAASVAVAASAGLGAMLLVSNLIGSAMLIVGGRFASWEDGTVQFAWLASIVTFAGALAFAGVMVVAAGVAGRVASSMPGWLSTASLVAGGVMLLGSAASVADVDALESAQLLILLLNLWGVVVAVVHLVHRPSSSVASTTASVGGAS
jgi:hypothetical protein